MKKVWVTTDCTCDLSETLLDKYDLKVVYFYIATEHGYFKDLAEITSTNIVEYFEQGGQQIHTTAPDASEYIEFFTQMLQKYEEIIHITIGSSVSLSYKSAISAAKHFNNKVHVFDTGHLSTGIAHFVIKAIELLEENKSIDDILATLEDMKNKVSTSFIAYNADYLYRAGKVSKLVKNVCSFFKIHPVLFMKNGDMKLKTIQIGNYDKSVLRYVRRELKKPNKIKRNRLFITYSTCPVKLLAKVNALIKKLCPVEELIETKASATVTSNCGANTIGILFVEE